MKKTVKKIQKYKIENKKIAALTAYDFYTAKYIDSAGIDLILEIGRASCREIV